MADSADIAYENEQFSMSIRLKNRIRNRLPETGAYFHERRSLNNFHRDRVITFEQIAE
ncbi:hypothetical protein HEM24_015350 [Escherichia coli]|nr:hypothetical protein [Escherichia coli]